MTRVERWEQRTQWPLAGVAVLFLAAYTWLVLEPGLPEGVRAALQTIDLATWGVFLADYVIRVALARHRARYVIHHLLDLLIVALPMLRPLRLLQLLALLKAVNRQAVIALRGRVIVYAAVAAVIVTFAASLAALSAERGQPSSNINSFGNALWWAVTTITTVGYGDLYPVTVEGRLVATALMLTGIALLGVVTASIASWLVSRVSVAEDQQDDPERAATFADVQSLRDELFALRNQLAAAGRPGAEGSSGVDAGGAATPRPGAEQGGAS